ncbi:MAG: Na+ dependent nucleoside transporter, partial [Bacteroidetes bacterium SW_10_40_5]
MRLSLIAILASVAIAVSITTVQADSLQADTTLPHQDTTQVESSEQGNGFGDLLGTQEESKSYGTIINDIFRGLLGLGSLVFIAFLLSNNKRRIDWKLVVIGLTLQISFALLMLKVDFARYALNDVSSFFVTLLDFSQEGAEFLFGKELAKQYVAFRILPTIIFFSALTSIFYYLNILQWIVYGFAWLMRKTMRLSGAESLSAAANVFIGQTEAPLMVKPYIDKMTRSEIMALMTGGMATIAGGVLAAYIGFLGGQDDALQQLFAMHLLTASVMSAPAALLVAKIMIPETHNVDKQLLISGESQGTNLLDAISYGTAQGLRLAVNVGAMLLVFLALM